MDFKRIDEDTVEAMPDELTHQELLEGMARLSYETAGLLLPHFIQPFETPASMVDFKGLVTDEALHMDFMNGRLCSIHDEGRGFFVTVHGVYRTHPCFTRREGTVVL